MNVGAKIKELIENHPQLKYMSKREVAKLIGTSENNLYQLFKKDSVETKYLLALCKASGESIDYFFSSEVNEPTVFYGNKIDIEKEFQQKEIHYLKKITDLQERLLSLESKNQNK